MSKTHHTTWLVYEEREVYDGGMVPLLVTETKALADQAKADIERAIEQVRGRLNRMPDPDEQGISDEEWTARFEARSNMLERFRWPHRIKRDTWAWDFAVRVMRLPFATEAR